MIKNYFSRPNSILFTVSKPVAKFLSTFIKVIYPDRFGTKKQEISTQ